MLNIRLDLTLLELQKIISLGAHLTHFSWQFVNGCDNFFVV